MLSIPGNEQVQPKVTLRRRKSLMILFILAVMAITATSVLRETSMSMQYGMAHLRVGDQKVYVKARTCGMNCAPELWLSRSSDRCHPPDPATDYIGVNNTFLYAVQDRTLYLVAEPQALHSPPPSATWLNIRFLPPYGHASDAYPLRYILFGDSLAKPKYPGEQIDFASCVRAFGHTWN